MSDTQVELDVFAAVGKLIVSQLEGRDELARAIFVALAPQFEHRSYPALKTLTHIVLEHVKEEDPETKDEIIARLQGGAHHKTFTELLTIPKLTGG